MAVLIAHIDKDTRENFWVDGIAQILFAGFISCVVFAFLGIIAYGIKEAAIRLKRNKRPH